jgi:hypothetical protein
MHKGPSINQTTGKVTFTPEYVASLTAFVKEFGAQMIDAIAYYVVLFGERPQVLAVYLAAWDTFAQANPWAGQYFFYVADEPHTLEQYNLAKQYGDIIHAYAPSVKRLVALDNPPRATWPNLDDASDIYVLLFSLATPANIQKYHDLNKDVWVYTALTRTGPVWELDSDLLNFRIPAWCSYILGVKGILYWSTTVWAGDARRNQPYIDTWTTPVTFQMEGGYTYNGEGSLLYSGVPAGIQGPVASMRLKVFRDSVEDFDYLKLFESLTSRDQAVSQASSIAKDFVTYDKNPESYIAKRKAIAEMIVNQLGKK